MGKHLDKLKASNDPTRAVTKQELYAVFGELPEHLMAMLQKPAPKRPWWQRLFKRGDI